jgi:hypothetical protein
MNECFNLTTHECTCTANCNIDKMIINLITNNMQSPRDLVIGNIHVHVVILTIIHVAHWHIGGCRGPDRMVV